MMTATPSLDQIHQVGFRYLAARKRLFSGQTDQGQEFVPFVSALLDLPLASLDPQDVVEYRECLESVLDFIRITAIPGTEYSVSDECMPMVELLMNACADRLIEMHS